MELGIIHKDCYIFLINFIFFSILKFVYKEKIMEEIKKLAELVENCGHITKLLLASEIAMNDGELETSQKYMKEAQGHVKVMLDDVFIEVREMFNIENDEVVDYDLPTTMEMARVLNDAIYNAGVLINLILDNSSEIIMESVKVKIIKDLNTITEIAQAIFFN